ncbi:MAG: exodeoxyribonuclease VII small subunit [Clostridiales bacterium]|nr:exodeoxyribonuclease VII small subunit [Clostridiales bacterium]
MATKTFEASMAELEEVVAQLETGDISLDDSLKLFEKGIKLAKSCQKKLDEAERRVKILTADAEGEMTEEDFGGVEE